MQKLFENAFAVLHDIRHEIPSTLFAIWRGAFERDNPEFIHACQRSLDIFAEEKILVMISDHSGLVSAPPDVLELIQEWYFPTAIRNGLKAEIVLGADEILGQISLEMMYDQDDMAKFIETSKLLTPKVDTLENAKELARQIVERFQKA